MIMQKSTISPFIGLRKNLNYTKIFYLLLLPISIFYHYSQYTSIIQLFIKNTSTFVSTYIHIPAYTLHIITNTIKAYHCNFLIPISFVMIIIFISYRILFEIANLYITFPYTHILLKADMARSSDILQQLYSYIMYILYLSIYLVTLIISILGALSVYTGMLILTCLLIYHLPYISIIAISTPSIYLHLYLSQYLHHYKKLYLLLHIISIYTISCIISWLYLPVIYTHLFILSLPIIIYQIYNIHTQRYEYTTKWLGHPLVWFVLHSILHMLH